VIRHATPARAPLKGNVRVPGDKSISHRAVLFSAMSDGPCGLTGVLDSEDVRATIDAVRSLGARVDEQGSDARGLMLEVTGWGSAGPTRPLGAIDCGNSGTTARLLLGALAGWDVEATLTGDASLSVRPMGA
jgi:3-phosphoshikimate 1-carboxyvinyltransferase